MSITDHFTKEAWEEERMILQSEMEAALKSIGRNKAPATDEIPIELFQALDDGDVKALTRISKRHGNSQRIRSVQYTFEYRRKQITKYRTTTGPLH